MKKILASVLFVIATVTFSCSQTPAKESEKSVFGPGIEFSEADIQPDLDRRKPGQSSVTTQRKEDDEAKIIAGVFEGVGPD